MVPVTWNVFPCRYFCAGSPRWTNDTTVGSQDQHRPNTAGPGGLRSGSVSSRKTSQEGGWVSCAL